MTDKLIKIITIQLAIIVLLFAFNKAYSPLAVNWNLNEYGIKSEQVEMSNDDFEAKLRKSIDEKLSPYEKLYDKDILHFNQVEVISNTKNASVIIIRTSFTTNATVQTNGKYIPLGEKTYKLSVALDDDINIKWDLISDTFDLNKYSNQ